MSRKLRHDRHTVSLLTDHMVFSQKYRGKILTGDIAMLTEAIIQESPCGGKLIVAMTKHCVIPIR
jgi:REP element-mobilizing transposase RayT